LIVGTSFASSRLTLTDYTSSLAIEYHTLSLHLEIERDLRQAVSSGINANDHLPLSIEMD
jgi:hypothetical protein